MWIGGIWAFLAWLVGLLLALFSALDASAIPFMNIRLPKAVLASNPTNDS